MTASQIELGDNTSYICQVCSGKDRKPFCKIKKFSLVSCKTCGMVSVFPLPSLKALEKFYRDSYLEENFLRKIESERNRKVFRSFLKVIRSFTKGNKLLEIGCAYGYFLKEAKKEGWDVSGIDISAEAVSFARNTYGLNIICSSIEELHPGNEKSDVIVIWHVLEHLLDPKEVVCKTKDFLDTNGLLCIRVPNIKSLTARLNGKDWPWLIPPVHLYHFNLYTLQLFLENIGFDLIYLETRHYPGESRNPIFLSLQAIVSKAHLLNLLKRKVVDKKGERIYNFDQPRTETTKATGRIVKILNWLEKTTDVLCLVLTPLFKVIWYLGLGEEIFVIARRR